MTNDNNILIVISSENDKLSSIHVEMLSKAQEIAKKLSKDIIALCIGDNIDNISKEAISYGADKIICIEDIKLKKYNSLVYAKILKEIIKKYSPYLVMIPSNENGKDLSGQIIQAFNLGAVIDCTDIAINDDEINFIKPTYGNNLFSNNRILSKPIVITVKEKSFKKLNKDVEKIGEFIYESIDIEKEFLSSEIIEIIKKASEKKPLLKNEIVVSCGRGIESMKNFPIIQDLATSLNAAIGISKGIVDEGWLPYDMQVGATGKIIAPRLYIAIGINGSSQHIAGMKDSEIIIAINNDEKAPIFKISDFGIIGDFKEIVPILTQKINSYKKLIKEEVYEKIHL